jgi:hypothetical protein
MTNFMRSLDDPTSSHKLNVNQRLLALLSQHGEIVTHQDRYRTTFNRAAPETTDNDRSFLALSPAGFPLP